MTEPTSSQIPTKPRKPLWRRILKWTLRVVAVLVVVLVLVWSIWNFRASRPLRNEILKIRAAGEPVTFADLAASLPDVDKADDAGPYYAAGLVLMARIDTDELDRLRSELATVIDRQASIEPKLMVAVESLLKDNRSALEMLDLGSAMSKCGYNVDIEGGICSLGITIPARCLARTASIRTNSLALQGLVDEAVESAISCLRFVRVFDRQPILICHLVRLACSSTVVGDIQTVLELTQPSGRDLLELGEALLKAEQSLDLKKALVADRVYEIETMRNIIPLDLDLEDDVLRPTFPEQWPRSFAHNPTVRTMACRLLRVDAQVIEAADKDFPELLDAIQIVAQQEFSVWDSLGKLIVTSMERMAVQHGRALASIRSARLALMIEGYRRERGKLPESLDDLRASGGTELPVDPFTGKDLVYKRLPSEYMVYSLGQDLQDNGGPLAAKACCGVADGPMDHGLRVRILKPVAD